MKVENSTFITKKKPLLLKLRDMLLQEYDYVSLLAQDSKAKQYAISARGISVSQDDLLTKRGFVIRVLDEKGYGEYACSIIEEDTLSTIVKEIDQGLQALSRLPEGLNYMERAKTQQEPFVFEGATEYEIHPDSLGDGQIVSKLGRLRDNALSLDDKLVDFNLNISYQENHKLFISNNRELTQNTLWTAGMAAAIASKGQELKVSYKTFSHLGGMELLESMEGELQSIVQTAVELLSSESMVPGEYDCICDPETTGMIVHEAFGHGVEMDMFVKDRALAKSFIGKQVASPLVTMHDGACAGQETGSYFFDDEGTMAHDTLIIDKGILVTGISDIRSAQSLGTVPTGNGRRESFERKAYTRMTNTFFEGGKDKLEDMIASVQYGFLLQQPSSGMEDPKNWGIQCMVDIAREIKDGKLTGRIFSPIVLTGYVPDLLKSISMMSEKVELSGCGFCGKGYKEWVKVSDGGPYIKARIRLG